jgi:hypothetical protein
MPLCAFGVLSAGFQQILKYGIFEVIATPQGQMFNGVTPVKRQDGIGGSRLLVFMNAVPKNSP